MIKNHHSHILQAGPRHHTTPTIKRHQEENKRKATKFSFSNQDDCPLRDTTYYKKIKQWEQRYTMNQEQHNDRLRKDSSLVS